MMIKLVSAALQKHKSSRLTVFMSVHNTVKSYPLTAPTVLLLFIIQLENDSKERISMIVL